jgi:hypothetical protein
MTIQYASRLTYANGISAQGVKVSIFDRDAPGKSDDNLTITPGLSDALGSFTVEYDPSRAMDTSQVTHLVPRKPPFDWTLEERTRLEPDPDDTFQPYLQFEYSLGNDVKTGTAPLNPSAPSYQLTDVLPARLTPTLHGFHFVNSFSGFFLPFALPPIPGLTKTNSVYGLCGGMSASALDFFLANRPIPATNQIPNAGTPLQRYLYKRQLDSLGTMGEVILRFVDWMGRPEDGQQGTNKLTLDEFTKFQPVLDRFTPQPLGLQYVKWKDTNQVMNNHQVLAHAYTRAANGVLQIQIYDPNYPDRDDISIEASPVTDTQGVPGLHCVQHVGSSFTKPLYGFFAMPYQAVIPPQTL